MAQTTSGLAAGGITARYAISYESALPDAGGLAVAQGLMEACDQDFDLMSGWFAGTEYRFDFPVKVEIQSGNGGGSWTASGSSVTVLINAIDPAPEAGVEFVRYLLVSEVTEQFMVSKDNGWFDHRDSDEGSKGEGLSRFLGAQLALQRGFAGRYKDWEVVAGWLNSKISPTQAPGSARPNYVDNDPDDNKPDIINGCTTCFIFYLHDQLGYGITDIINAGGATLGAVYQKLTGRSDGWQSFIDLVDLHYPAGATYSTTGDNIFPVPNLRTLGGFTSAVTAGASIQVYCSLDEKPPADVSIAVVSDNPALLIVPETWALTAGTMDGFIEVRAAPVSGPEQSAAVHAAYAGQTLTTAIVVLPRKSMITGVVSDVSGVLGGAVVLVDQLPMPSGVHMQLMTGGDGSYSTPTVPPGLYRVEASASGHVDAESNVTVLEGVPTTDADIVLPVAVPFVIGGSVSDQTAAAIAGASLMLEGGDGYQILATSDALGRYSLSQDPGPFLGPCTLTATYPGYTEVQVALAVSNGASLTEDFRLSQLGSLTGVVTDATGTTPVPMATVLAGQLSATSDATGRYQLPGLPPGPTAVTVSADGFEVAAATIAVGAGLATTENFALVEATASLTGTVFDPDGTPFEDAEVYVPGARAQAHNLPGGAYRVTGIPAGHLLVTVRAARFATQQSYIDFTAHQAVSVNWYLGPLHPGPFPP